MRAIPSFGHKRQHQADQEFANTLALLAEAATNGLRDRLRAVFAHFYDSLFEQASVSDDASEHVFNLAMLREVKSQQLDINESFCAEIKCHFQALTAKVVPIANSTEAGRIAGRSDRGLWRGSRLCENRDRSMAGGWTVLTLSLSRF